MPTRARKVKNKKSRRPAPSRRLRATKAKSRLSTGKVVAPARVGMSVRQANKARREAAIKAAAVPKKGLKLSKKEEQIELKTNRLLAKGRERGYVTYDEILKEFPTVEEDILF